MFRCRIFPSALPWGLTLWGTGYCSALLSTPPILFSSSLEAPLLAAGSHADSPLTWECAWFFKIATINKLLLCFQGGEKRGSQLICWMRLTLESRSLLCQVTQHENLLLEYVNGALKTFLSLWTEHIGQKGAFQWKGRMTWVSPARKLKSS